MDFKEVLKNRVNTLSWADTPVPKTMILEILEDMHRLMPSKQCQFPFDIAVLDWSESDLRNKIFAEAHRDDALPVEEDLGNPQLLAPWLIVFSLKECTGLPEMEVGISAAYISLLASSKGLGTGLCRCFGDVNKNTAKPSNGNHTVLLMGIGYAGNKKTYLDPRTNTEKRIVTDSKYNRERARPLSSIVNWYST